jgi:hypothetical protein
MTLIELLHQKPDLILLDSTDNLVRSNLTHYKKLNPENIRLRLMHLFQTLITCVETGSCGEMVKFMDKVSEERFESGFEIHEVQTAINILEESLWRNIGKFVDNDKQVNAMKEVTCILSKAKDEMANEYAMLSKELF